MKKMDQLVVSWSGGKDASLALYYSSKLGKIKYLNTSISASQQRISMHGVPFNLLKKQAEALNIPLQTYELPESSSLDAYNQVIHKMYTELDQTNINSIVFGDIFLEDLKKFREEQLKPHKMKALFPLWRKDTSELAKTFGLLGFRAIVVAVSGNKLDESFCGVEYNSDFINRLPEGVDPCGENGEFHTFVYDGPIFSQPVKFKNYGNILKTYENDSKNKWDNSFWFCDIRTD